MRLKAMLGVCALLLVSACAADVTAPSTSRSPATYRADTGLPTMGSGGYTDSSSVAPPR
ncbi:MAG TPA: hypothetical protein VEX86_11765 [Longimicrobium sp.]|nr:hypothetical protein [Longimicrobium sp.]